MKKSNIILLGLLFLCFSLALLSFFHIDPDYYWHIKVGEKIVTSGIVKHDLFSWVMQGKYWMSHEWLFEVILYGFQCFFGKYHAIIYCLFSLLLLFSILFFTNYRAYLKNFSYTIVYLLFFGILSLGFIQTRPYLLSFSLLALTMYLLFDLYYHSESKKIYLLPIITIIWANVHGGSSNLPYLFCFVFWIIGMVSFQLKKIESKKLKKIQIRRYFIVMILCIIGVCINAHGIKMLLYPYINMADNTMINTINEWQSSSLHIPFHYTYFIFLLFLLFTFLFSSKKIQFIDLILFLICTYLGLKSIRFWIFTPIIMSYVIFSYVEAKKTKGLTSSIIILCVFFISIFLCHNSILSKQYEGNISSEALSILKKANPKRLFNGYRFGGELIYHDVSVFIDGRADLYSGTVYNDYLSIIDFKKEAVPLIEKYDFDYYLLMNNCSLDTYLGYNDQFELVYSDKKLNIYKKIVN